MPAAGADSGNTPAVVVAAAAAVDGDENARHVVDDENSDHDGALDELPHTHSLDSHVLVPAVVEGGDVDEVHGVRIQHDTPLPAVVAAVCAQRQLMHLDSDMADASLLLAAVATRVDNGVWVTNEDGADS